MGDAVLISLRFSGDFHTFSNVMLEEGPLCLKAGSGACVSCKISQQTFTQQIALQYVWVVRVM